MPAHPHPFALEAHRLDQHALKESPALGYVLAAALVALVTIIGVSLNFAGDIANVALLYLLPVMAAATNYGLRVGIVAGVLSSLACNFFFVPPIYTLTIADPSNLVTVAVLTGVAIVTSQLAARVRTQADLAQRSSRANAALALFARTLSGISDTRQMGQTLCAEVARLFDVHAVLLQPSKPGLAITAAFPSEEDLGSIDMVAANWAMEHNQAAGRGSEMLTAADWLFHPLTRGGPAIGVVGVSRPDGEAVRFEQLPMLSDLINQATLAFERAALDAEMAAVAQLKERDRLRAALLSSVSHDLRTPLTTIMASAAQIRAAKCQGLDPLIVEGLVDEAERLNRFVANLLDMARVEAGALRLAIEPVDLTDATAAAIHDLRRSLDQHPIRVEVAPDLPLVRVDPQLFHHCLINLLDNAGKYSRQGTAIMIRANRTGDGLTLSILDEGPGFPVGSEAQLFETFTRLEGSDRKGGTGLGLAIVKGFAEAMGVHVTAANRDDCQGAMFSLHFPRTLLIASTAQEASE